jgi:lipid-A-disaccharide synthase
MKLCIITGEASGDLHAAHLVHELRKLEPNLELFGTGGDGLRAEGMRILHDIRELAIVGLFNVLAHLPQLFRVRDDILEAVERENPDGVLLVDYPDFNLRLAKKLRRKKVPIYYYISPQVWAWRQGRVRHIGKVVDHMLVLFPFEEAFYAKHNVPVSYVGHPLQDQLESLRQERPPLAGRPPRIALLPGSRRMEVQSLLPAMKDAALELRRRLGAEIFIVRASTIDRAQIDEILGPDATQFEMIEEEGRSVLAGADISFCSSGTATLESAILGVPPIVMYKLPPLTYAVAKRLVKLPHISLVNIVAGRKVVPELVQHEVTTARIVETAEALLAPAAYRQVISDLEEVREKLGEAGASKRAAAKIYTLVTQQKDRARAQR